MLVKVVSLGGVRAVHFPYREVACVLCTSLKISNLEEQYIAGYRTPKFDRMHNVYQ